MRPPNQTADAWTKDIVLLKRIRNRVRFSKRFKPPTQAELLAALNGIIAGVKPEGVKPESVKR